MTKLWILQLVSVCLPTYSSGLGRFYYYYCLDCKFVERIGDIVFCTT